MTSGPTGGGPAVSQCIDAVRSCRPANAASGAPAFITRPRVFSDAEIVVPAGDDAQYAWLLDRPTPTAGARYSNHRLRPDRRGPS